MPESLAHDLAIVWIVFGLVALLGLITTWIIIATVNQKYDSIHTFVASLIGCRFLFCIVPLIVVVVLELSNRQWGVIDCQLVYWAWTTSCVADLITVIMALLFTLTSCIPGCLRIRKLAVDTSVSFAWVVATVTAGIMSLVHKDLNIPDTCTLLPHADEYKLGVTVLVLYFGGGVLIVFLGSGAAAYLTIYKHEEGNTVSPTHTNGNIPNAVLTSSHHVHVHSSSVPSDQTSAILNVASSLTALLNLIPQCVVLSINLLGQRDVTFGQHIIIGMALLHSLALPISLPLVSADYRRALLKVFKRGQPTSTTYDGIDDADGTNTSVSSPPETLDLSVPDIVVCDMASSVGYDNNAFDEPDGVTQNGRLPKGSPPPVRRNGHAAVRRTTTTVVYQNPPRVLKRSQSQQTRKEWVRMMQRTFLPYLRNKNKPDIISNHMSRASTPGAPRVEVDGDDDDDVSYDYDDIEEVLDNSEDTDKVQESDVDKKETGELNKSITNSNIDISKYVVDKDTTSSDIQNDTSGEPGDKSFESESGTLTKNKISTNPRHRGHAYNDDDNYFNATLKRQLLLKQKSASFKEVSNENGHRKPQSSSDSPPCSSRESSFKSTHSSSSTLARMKNDPFSTEWTKAFLRTHGVGRHSSRLSHERPGLSRKLSRLESFHGTLRRDQLPSLSRHTSSARSLLNRSPRPRRGSRQHSDSWRHRESSSRKVSMDYPRSERNPFLLDHPYLTDYRDMYFPHPLTDRYMHEIALLHAQLARPYALTPFSHLPNPYLLSQPTLDLGLLNHRAYPVQESPFLTNNQAPIHKQYSVDDLASTRTNPFLDYSSLSNGTTEPTYASTGRNPFREYMEIEEPPTKPSTNPFYMDPPNEIYEDIDFPPVAERGTSPQAEQTQAKSKDAKSKWKKPSLSRSIVDFLRSRSFKLSVLDNGEKVTKSEKVPVTKKLAGETTHIDSGHKDEVPTESIKGDGEPRHFKLQEDGSIEVEDGEGAIGGTHGEVLEKRMSLSLAGRDDNEFPATESVSERASGAKIIQTTPSKTVYQTEYL